jgi:hypothetical protein
MRTERARQEDGIVFNCMLFHAVFDHFDLQVQPARHLDGPAEGDFAVALTEVNVTD